MKISGYQYISMSFYKLFDCNFCLKTVEAIKLEVTFTLKSLQTCIVGIGKFGYTFYT